MATGTAGTSARQFHTQQVHYLRTLVNYNDADIAGRKIGTIPAGSNILRTNTVASTANNAGTSATLSVGFSSAGATDLVNATSVASATANVVTQAPSGKALLASDTDIYVTLTMSGTAATAGVAEVIVEYAPAI
jgi:hypothetical protein